MVKGSGIIASVDGHMVAVGNAALMEREGIKLDTKAKPIARFEKRELARTDCRDGELKILMGVRDRTPWVKENLISLKNLASGIS